MMWSEKTFIKAASWLGVSLDEKDVSKIQYQFQKLLNPRAGGYKSNLCLAYDALTSKDKNRYDLIMSRSLGDSNKRNLQLYNCGRFGGGQLCNKKKSLPISK